MSAPIPYLPVVREGAAGRGRSPASLTVRGDAGDPKPRYKRGRDVRVGDQIIAGRDAFLVIGFTRPTRFGREAVNVWGETTPVNNRKFRRVLNPSLAAATSQE